MSAALACLAALAAFAAARWSRPLWSAVEERFLRPRAPRAAVADKFADLPDFLELLALSLTCGHPLASAWQASTGFMRAGALRQHLELASRALAYGRPADRCMNDLAGGIGDPRASMALALVAQAMTMGNAVEPALLAQAASLRRLRMTDIERRAQTAPLRMMLPVMGLIMPAVLIVLLGPIVIRLAQGGLFT